MVFRLIYSFDFHHLIRDYMTLATFSLLVFSEAMREWIEVRNIWQKNKVLEKLL
jgi:hypothetical protein